MFAHCTIFSGLVAVISAVHVYAVGGGGLHVAFFGQVTSVYAMHLSPWRVTVQCRSYFAGSGLACSTPGRGGFAITTGGFSDGVGVAGVGCGSGSEPRGPGCATGGPPRGGGAVCTTHAGIAASVTTNGVAKVRRKRRALMGGHTITLGAPVRGPRGGSVGPMRPGVFVLALALALVGCRDDSCLRGTCGLPCEDISFACTPQALYVGPVADAPAAYRLRLGDAALGDILISNGVVTGVISSLDAPNGLAPTGGNLIDFGPAGGEDDVTVYYQLSGILPDDAFAYRTLDVAERGGSVTVTLRGSLDGRPEVGVATHYELRACDPGLRIRSELFNGSADTEAFMIADASQWGNRRVVPFVPEAGQGYEQPELELLELSSLWKGSEYMAGAAPAPASPGYAAISCDRDEISGVNDLEISALGTPITFMAPGDTLIHERFLIAQGAGSGPAPAIDAALAARAQLFDRPARTVRGRVVAGGLGFGGDVRRASVMIRVGDHPATAVVPAADGTFSATIADRGKVTAEVWSFGHAVTSTSSDATGDIALGDLAIAMPATVELAVTEAGSGIWALAAFHPADDATAAVVSGTFHGRMITCAPWLGPPNGASPACNEVLVAPVGTELEVPAGRYTIYASAGPDHTLARTEVALAAGEVTSVALALQKLEVSPPGWLSADLHVHGRASFDSGFPDDDRVRSFAAAGVDVIAATDHDIIGDYTDTVRALGLEDRIAVMGGLETTQIIPWMDVPGEDLPRVIGHFNFWPLRRLPGALRAGAPWDERIEPGQLFDTMAPLVGAHGMMQLNHPWDEPFFGRDLGYLRAIKFDPRRSVDDRATNNPVLLDRPGGHHRNADWNAIEVLNGADPSELMKARLLWFSLLSQGLVAAGTGNSDSHGMTDARLGWARNWVDTRTTVASFDANVFDDDVRAGKVIAGNGVVVTVEVGPASGPRRGLSFAPYVPAPGDVLAITVRAPPWVPVEEVRVVTAAGTRVIASGAQLLHPADPFGTAGVLRYTAQIPLAQLVTRDDFLIVEAGLPYPDAADLDDDGVPDTTDNNGDGVIDDRDIEPDEDAGPLTAPADPTDPADPRYWMTRVIPGAYPEGFTNPILVDLDGSGWLPPGLPK